MAGPDSNLPPTPSSGDASGKVATIFLSERRSDAGQGIPYIKDLIFAKILNGKTFRHAGGSQLITREMINNVRLDHLIIALVRGANFPLPPTTGLSFLAFQDGLRRRYVPPRDLNKKGFSNAAWALHIDWLVNFVNRQQSGSRDGHSVGNTAVHVIPGTIMESFIDCLAARLKNKTELNMSEESRAETFFQAAEKYRHVNDALKPALCKGLGIHEDSCPGSFVDLMRDLVGQFAAKKGKRLDPTLQKGSGSRAGGKLPPDMLPDMVVKFFKDSRGKYVLPQLFTGRHGLEHINRALLTASRDSKDTVMMDASLAELFGALCREYSYMPASYHAPVVSSPPPPKRQEETPLPFDINASEWGFSRHKMSISVRLDQTALEENIAGVQYQNESRGKFLTMTSDRADRLMTGKTPVIITLTDRPPQGNPITIHADMKTPRTLESFLTQVWDGITPHTSAEAFHKFKISAITKRLGIEVTADSTTPWYRPR